MSARMNLLCGIVLFVFAIVLSAPAQVVAGNVTWPQGTTGCVDWETEYIDVDFIVELPGHRWYADVEITAGTNDSSITLRIFPGGDLTRGFQLQNDTAAETTWIVGLPQYVPLDYGDFQIHIYGDAPFCYEVVYRLLPHGPQLCLLNGAAIGLHVENPIVFYGQSWYMDLRLFNPSQEDSAVVTVHVTDQAGATFNMIIWVSPASYGSFGSPEWQEARLSGPLYLEFTSTADICIDVPYAPLTTSGPTVPAMPVPSHVTLPPQAGPKCDKLKPPVKNPLCAQR